MNDKLASPKNYQELSGGTGTVEVDSTQLERFEEFTHRISSGEFHLGTTETVLCKCIDGRSCDHAVEGLNSAGGSLSYLVADDLTTKHFTGATFHETLSNTFELLASKDQKTGVHTDTHAAGEKSGCGANDRLPEIYACIATDSGAMRAMAETILGFSIDDSLHNHLTTNAADRTDFGVAADNLTAAVESGAQVEELEGGHREIVTIINMRSGTTLDRAAVKREFGANYQSFNVDAYGFKAAADVISESDEDAKQKIVALAYYNIATALVLCGPKMRVSIMR